MTNAVRYLRALADIQFDIAKQNWDDPLHKELTFAINVLQAFQEDWDLLEQLRNDYHD